MKRFLRHYRRGVPLKDAMYRKSLGPAGRARFTLLRLVRPVWHPVRRFVEIMHATRRWSGVARAAGGAGALGQFVQQIELAVRHGVRPSDYYLYMLYRPENRAVADRFIYHHQMDVALKYLRELIDPSDISNLGNKFTFFHFCRRHDLACIPILAHVDGDSIESIGEAGSAGPPDTDLFSKPVDMGEGKGARMWSRTTGGKWTGSDNVPLDFDGVLDRLKAQSNSLGRAVILQPKLSNHPSLEALTGSPSLCSVRMISMRLPSGEHAPLIAMICLPHGESISSNFSGGNLGAPIDLDTGELGSARYKDSGTIMNDHASHPDSGSRISGFRLPDWKSAVDLVMRAHATLNDLPFVGWDVALTADGPVLIEGNQGFGSESPQLAHLKPLGNTDFPDVYGWHVERRTTS
ncbi:MAG: hypothetical protein HKN17_01745 [Rhodothermales bacterium]|nr:hypothetical protein [Rhodothermales bacterium]